jgi:uncharacterized membrane protein YcaP (DUF421 family)
VAIDAARVLQELTNQHARCIVIDWQPLFGLETPVLELFLRGTLMYWFLFLIFRFVMRRDAGAIGIADILLIVIIADASQNAISGDYKSITEGMLVVGTIVMWNVLTNWLNFKSPVFARFAEPPPLQLVREGRVLEGNMRREMLTHAELMAKLREQGIERAEEVLWAYMESDGQISVRKYADDGQQRPRPRQGGGLPA